MHEQTEIIHTISNYLQLLAFSNYIFSYVCVCVSLCVVPIYLHAIANFSIRNCDIW